MEGKTDEGHIAWYVKVWALRDGKASQNLLYGPYLTLEDAQMVQGRLFRNGCVDDYPDTGE